MLHEATVGAGLPIIDTYHKLTESGDRVERIEGLLSGTLGFVLTRGLGRARRSPDAVRHAMSRGYTEPDPREDLSGMDVGRKALILARLLGYPGELSRTAVESLVPKWAPRAAAAPSSSGGCNELDAGWRRRVEEAAADGMVLRYVATVTPAKIAVGLRAVPATSPLAAIKGSDNQLVFTTARYKDNPLVITGPGRGRRGDGGAACSTTSSGWRARERSHERRVVTAFAPGGVGNVGPGLDILGLAVAGAGDAVRAEWTRAPGHPDARPRASRACRAIPPATRPRSRRAPCSPAARERLVGRARDRALR